MCLQAQHQAAYLDGIATPLRISSAPTPAPGPDQVLIKAKAVAINPVDWKIQELGLTVSAWPFILGRDIAGEVVAVGKDVKSLYPGSRVLAQSLSLTTKKIEEGTFQEYVLASVKSTARIPDGMTYEQASVLPLAVSTSASALFSPSGLDLQLPSHSVQASGKAVLIWGGSSSVGCVGIQLAVAAGFDVYTTCSKKNFSLVEALGAKKVFDYSSLNLVGDIVAELQKVTTVVGAYDAIGEHKSQIQTAQILAQLGGGKIATVLNPAEDLPATVVSTRISAASIFFPPQEDIGKSIFQDFLPKALANGQVKAKPDPEVVGYRLQALQGALDKLKAGVSARKIVSDTPTSFYPFDTDWSAVYDLPSELLLSLTLRSGDTPRHGEPQQPADPTPDPKPDEDDEEGGAGLIGCNLCMATFYNVQDQRQHVRSDFHRYNLKLHIKGLSPVSEAAFIKQIGDLDESISGSESEESEEEEEDPRANGDSTLTALLKRQAKILQQEKDGEDVVKRQPTSAGNAPLLWLQSPKLSNHIALGVYRALLSEPEKEQAKTSLVELLKSKQVKPIHGKQSGPASVRKALPSSDPHFLLLMIGGGHFAAAIVSLIPELRKGPGGIEERHPIVKAHKTFHRYTTRRKQGGSQSSNDNAKGNAHSAGSSIRRYNEAALETDVRTLLAEWKGMIDNAELIFVRATGTTSRRTLFGPYDEQVLQVKDQRVRGFPFNTRRPTQAELLRSFSELTRLKISALTEFVVETPAEKAPTKAPKPKPVPVKLSKEEEAALLHTSQLQALIRRTKAPGLLLYLAKNELTPDFRFHPESDHHHAPTPLHLSASTNSSASVLALLTKAKADPTIMNGDGKTAYQIAGDMKTRDAFRIARHQLSDLGIDWKAAHVPAALSPEEADAKSKQEKAADDEAEAERRKADLEQIRREEEERHVGRIEKKAGAGKSLGVVEKTGSERREEEARGLTPEMRMKLERERRARAAEERMRKMAGAR